MMDVCTSVVPVKIGLPIKISARMQPTLHRSTETPYFVEPNKSSGGRYHSVITRLVSGCLQLGSKNVARPKSAILKMPLLSIRRLEPLMSLCKIPLL